MGNPLISIIVPIYNVEPYLHRCLNSIINQTYTNLEIILINDGSKDRCGDICDQYARKDSRIRLLHKENEGLACARNDGLKMATGKYIGWVDSDDWIELDMFEYLVANAEYYSSDITICGRVEHIQNKARIIACESIKLLNNNQAMEALLGSNSIANYMWDKLWRKELFHEISFPSGRTYEDVAVAHRLFLKAERVVCLPEEKYHYCCRKGSIINDFSIESRLNYFTVSLERSRELSSYSPLCQQLITAQCIMAAIRIWSCYCRNSKLERETYYPQIIEISKYCKVHANEVKENMELGFAGKTIVSLLPYTNMWAFTSAYFIDKAYKLKHGQYL